MPESRYSTRVPKGKWDEYKPIISRLYKTEKKPLKGPDGVMEIMSNTYGFSASPAQYWRTLERWGLYRYESRHDRRAQALRRLNRTAEGQETERNMEDSDHDTLTETNSIPRNIATSDSSSHRSALQCAPPGLLSPELPPLGSIEGWQSVSSFSAASAMFLSGVPSHGVESSFSHEHIGTSNANSGANDSFGSIWLTPNNEDIIPATSGNFHQLELSVNSSSRNFSSYEMDLGNLIGQHDPSPSTSSIFRAGFSSSPAALHGKFLPTDFAASIMPIISRMFPKTVSSSLMALFEDSSAFQAAMRNMSHSNSSRLVRQQSIDHQLIYMIFHRLINDGNAVEAFIEPQTTLDRFFNLGVKYCFSLGEKTLCTIVNSTPSPYKLALIQSLFRVALVEGHALVLRVIMSMGQGSLVHRPVTLGGYKHYPLKYTSLYGHVKATQVLLEYGADPNGHGLPSVLSSIGKLSYTEQKDPKARFQILKLLVDGGLRDSDPPTGSWESYHRDELLLLANHYLGKSFETFFLKGILPKVLLRLDWDESLSMTLRAILDRASSNWNESNDHHTILSETLSNAVLRNHVSAIDILLTRGAKPDIRCLISAVRNHNLEIFTDFLNRGLDPNVRVDEKPRRDRVLARRVEHCTALSESIRDHSRGAFKILQARGAISNLANQPAGFVPALVAACEVGDDTLVEQLLSLRIPPHRLAKPEGALEEALEVAIENNHYSIVKRLISSGIQPKMLCFIIAIQKGHLAIVELLAIYIDLSNEEGVRLVNDEVIIFEALQWGNQTVIETVLRMGHPVNILFELDFKDFQDWNLPSSLWMPRGHQSWFLSPLSAAILKGSSTAVKALLAHGARVQYKYYFDSSNRCILTPLAAAAVRQDLVSFTEFLRIGADPFDNGAIFICAVLELEGFIKLLLSAFRSRYPDGALYFGSEALSHVVRHGNTGLLGLIVKDTDMIGPPSRPLLGAFTSPLGEAIRLHSVCSGTARMLELLLPLIKDPNAVVHENPTYGRMTCLLYATALDSLKTVQKLHQAGADISLPAQWGIIRTPLQAAAQAGSREIVEYLLSEGVSANEPPAPRAGATALQLAAIAGDIAIASILLDAHADINAKPALFDGRTAFEGATEYGCTEMMLFLVHHGADLLANGSEQYRRAVQFAEDNTQYAAKDLADDLYKKALANDQTQCIGMDEIDWTSSFDTADFGDFPSGAGMVW